MLGHLRGLSVGYKYSDNWLASTMNRQVLLATTPEIGLVESGGGGDVRKGAADHHSKHILPFDLNKRSPARDNKRDDCTGWQRNASK